MNESIYKVKVIEPGREAIRRIKAGDFPAFILLDDKGHDFFQHVAPGCPMPH